MSSTLNDKNPPGTSVPAQPTVVEGDRPEIDYKAAMERLLTPALLKEHIGYHSENALMHAARDGDVDLVRILAPKSDLLALGGTSEDRTALNMAAAGGHLECVKILLERQPAEQCELGAWKYGGNLRPFDSAIANGHWECAQVLAPFTKINAWGGSSSERRPTPFLEAARQGRLDMLLWLIPQVDLADTPWRGWNSDRKNKNWLDLALEEAAGSHATGALDCVRHLAQRQDVRVTPEPLENGWQSGGALHKAILADNEKAALFLLPFFGAETIRASEVWKENESRTVSGSPLGLAIEMGSEKTVEAFLPVCAELVKQTDGAFSGGWKGVSKALNLAVKMAANLDGWHAADSEKTAGAWRIVDAVGAEWTKIATSDEYTTDTGRGEWGWLGAADIIDKRWEKFPRWRASIEARALREEIAKNRPQETIEGMSAAVAHKAPRI